MTRQRIQRNDQIVRELKQRYDDTCQLCGDHRQQGDDVGYSNVHHIKPLGSQHGGPDSKANMLVLCPTHHDDFDNGMLTVDPETLTITHDYEETLTGEAMTVKRSHSLDTQFLAYHNQTIANE